MLSTSLIRHENTSGEVLNEISKLKAIRWPKYSFQQHLNWLNENLLYNDFHVLIKDDEMLIAYFNLVEITAIINGKVSNMKGIGNVCTIASGKNYGNILMTEVKAILDKKRWQGLLLCKDELVSYYEKFQWQIIEKKLFKARDNSVINYMAYNIMDDIVSFEFKGHSF